MITKNAAARREISVVTWKDVRDDVTKVNPQLAKLIDNFNPDDTHKFAKVKYYYGDIFVKNGQTLFPNKENRLVPALDPSMDPKIQEEFSYIPNLAFIPLNRSSEVFFDTGQRAVPIHVFQKGQISSTYDTYDYLMGIKPNTIWSFSAGSRSIFMLPKITDKINLQKLCSTYNIHSTIQVKNLTDHWELFKNIAQNDQMPCDWHLTVLFFGKTWIDRKYRQENEAQLKLYFQKACAKNTNYAITKVRFNMFWETFASIISAQRLQTKSYLIDQVKHLLSIAVGNFPGFVVANNNEEIAPVKYLQNAFIEHYSLKEYLPTIMYAAVAAFCPEKVRHLYYSLAIPTVSEGSAYKETSTTIVNDLREIKLLLETLKKHADSNYNKQAAQLVQNANIDYFHHKEDIYDQIKSSNDIVLEDSSFLEDQTRFPDRTFCSTSPFFSGCMRIEKPNGF
jgi:hypothetical protein